MLYTHAIWVMCGYIEQKNWWKIISWERWDALNLLRTSEQVSFNRICAGFSVVLWQTSVFIANMSLTILVEWRKKRNILNFQQGHNGIQPVSVHFYYILLKFTSLLIKIVFFPNLIFISCWQYILDVCCIFRVANRQRIFSLKKLLFIAKSFVSVH